MGNYCGQSSLTEGDGKDDEVRGDSISKSEAAGYDRYASRPQDAPWIDRIRIPHVQSVAKKASSENEAPTYAAPLAAIGDANDVGGNNGNEAKHPDPSDVRLPVRIQPYLFLGNSACVRDVHRLQALNIRHVWNVAGRFALPSKTINAYKASGIAYHRIDALDQEGYPMLQLHWAAVAKALELCISRKESCVVHCMAGLNRSVLIVTAFYMKSNGVAVSEAVDHVRSQRGETALNNHSFQEQLVAFARLEGLLGAARM